MCYATNGKQKDKYLRPHLKLRRRKADLFNESDDEMKVPIVLVEQYEPVADRMSNGPLKECLRNHDKIIGVITAVLAPGFKRNATLEVGAENRKLRCKWSGPGVGEDSLLMDSADAAGGQKPRARGRGKTRGGTASSVEASQGRGRSRGRGTARDRQRALATADAEQAPSSTQRGKGSGSESHRAAGSAEPIENHPDERSEGVGRKTTEDREAIDALRKISEQLRIANAAIERMGDSSEALKNSVSYKRTRSWISREVAENEMACMWLPQWVQQLLCPNTVDVDIKNCAFVLCHQLIEMIGIEADVAEMFKSELTLLRDLASRWVIKIFTK